VFSERYRDKCHYDRNDKTLFPFRQIKTIFHLNRPSVAAATYGVTGAYLIGSATPASRKPFNRN
jgi:hypothetical protein